MDILNEYFTHWLISNIISLVLIGVCFKWPRLGNLLWAVIFFFAGLYNGLTTLQNPEFYYQFYGETSIPFYKNLIYGVFARNVQLFVALIAIGQIVISIGLFVKGKLYKIALIGAMAFLIAITPLGIGSGFPATLLMIISLLFLYRETMKRRFR